MPESPSVVPVCSDTEHRPVNVIAVESVAEAAKSSWNGPETTPSPGSPPPPQFGPAVAQKSICPSTDRSLLKTVGERSFVRKGCTMSNICPDKICEAAARECVRLGLGTSFEGPALKSGRDVTKTAPFMCQ